MVLFVFDTCVRVDHLSSSFVVVVVIVARHAAMSRRSATTTHTCLISSRSACRHVEPPIDSSSFVLGFNVIVFDRIGTSLEYWETFSCRFDSVSSFVRLASANLYLLLFVRLNLRRASFCCADDVVSENVHDVCEQGKTIILITLAVISFAVRNQRTMPLLLCSTTTRSIRWSSVARRSQSLLRFSRKHRRVFFVCSNVSLFLVLFVCLFVLMLRFLSISNHLNLPDTTRRQTNNPHSNTRGAVVATSARS